MNIFASLRIYACKWNEKEVRAFDQEEIEETLKAEIVDSQYGLSVCFFLKAGGQTYIPLDQNSTGSAGNIVDLHTAKLVTLCKAGKEDIYRVRL